MTDEKIEEVLFDISGKLASIETKLDSMSESILKHEARLTMLEQNFNNHISKKETDNDFKTEMLKLIGKCLIISLTAITSLVGGGSLLLKILQVQ